jgi:hypothetical protein
MTQGIHRVYIKLPVKRIGYLEHPVADGCMTLTWLLGWDIDKTG